MILVFQTSHDKESYISNTIKRCFMARKYLVDQIEWEEVSNFKSLLQITAGAGMSVLAMKGFMIPNEFMNGGITGISILLHEVFHINISLLVITLNFLFIYLAYKRFGKTFAVQTTVAVLFLSLGLIFLNINPITTDKLLIAVFGGILMGSGVGLVIRGGGIIDGAELMAVFSMRKTGLSGSEISLLFNLIIFASTTFIFSIETAMYSTITYFSANKATDYIVDGIEEFVAVSIVSSRYEEIKSFLVNEKKKGITVYKGDRGYLPGSFTSKAECEIIVTIISRLETKRLEEELMVIDPKAFVYMQRINETTGGVLNKKVHQSKHPLKA